MSTRIEQMMQQGSRTKSIVLVKPPIRYHLDPIEQAQLGILYIASVVRKAGYNVQLVDARDKTLEQTISEMPEADVYGFTSSFLDLSTCQSLAVGLKGKFPGVKTVIGGAGPTASPEYIDPHIFDATVIGEGEVSILQLLSDLEGGRLEKQYERLGLEKDELAVLPFPARDLLDYQGGPIFNYGKEYAPGQSTGVITSRGCPYECAFCASNSMWGRNTRFRPVKDVIAEVKYVAEEFGIRNFKFQDDTLTLNQERFMEFVRGMKELNSQFGNELVWRCYGARVDTVNEDMLSAMYNAGCREVDFGIETGDQDVLDLMNKGVNIEQSIRAIQLANSVGLETRAFMMVGLPGTTKKTAKRDIAFIERAKPGAINLAIYTPYPGSAVWKDPRKYGVTILEKPEGYHDLGVFDSYNMHWHSRDPNKKNGSLIIIDGLKPAQLETVKRQVFEYVTEKGLLHRVTRD